MKSRYFQKELIHREFLFFSISSDFHFLELRIASYFWKPRQQQQNQKRISIAEMKLNPMKPIPVDREYILVDHHIIRPPLFFLYLNLKFLIQMY